MLDLLIIGGSAAGISSAIYAARRNLNFQIVTKDMGGEVALSGEVGNWPGIISIQGYELAQKFSEHIKSYNPKIDQGWRVTDIQPTKNYHIITAEKIGSEQEKKEYQAKAVVIASGIRPRYLKIPGEEEYRGKGVTYCTVCDGPLYKNKTTATVGSGNSALESALMMAEISDKVYLLSKYSNTEENNGGFPPGENILIDKVKAREKIEVIYNAITTEIIGDTFVTGLKYKDLTNEQEKTLDVKGVMVHIGQIPNSHFTTCVELDSGGQIIVDKKCSTSCPGIFAAGDVTDVPYNQIGIATGQGIIAGLASIEYINKWEEK
ncbi:MAG: FAD-dependent oxidoreductase [bacterium]